MQVAKLLASHPWRTLGGICLCLFLALIVAAGLRGELGEIGPDNDDVMRLVQIKDFLGGQGWFDHTQVRLGPEGGTLMHWSRLVDLPIIVLAKFFDLFLPWDMALVMAYSVWPPLTASLVLLGIFIGVRNLRDNTSALIAAAFSAVVLLSHFRFAPGAIDHHNLQLGLLALTLGCLAGPGRKPALMALGGLALAATVAIGAEVYVFVAVFCAFVALDWAWAGPPARSGAMSFGLGLSAGLSVLFIGLIPPSQFTLAACDAFSPVSLMAGVTGGVGLAAAACWLSGRGRWMRLAGLGAVGVVCAIVLLNVGPQCLANPLDELSPLAKTLWLDRVGEARPVFAADADALENIPFRLGVILLAFIICGRWFWKREDLRAGALIFTLLTAAFLTTLYQVRFFAFGHLFAMLPLGIWVADSWVRGKQENPDSLGYLAAVALSVPMVWGFSGRMLQAVMSPADVAASTYQDCLSPGWADGLNGLPAGRILASSNFAPYILRDTDHSALNGNYHRNMVAIDASLSMLVSEAPDVRPELSRWRVDYVLMCQADLSARALIDYAPDGLLARLEREEVPDWLEEAGRGGGDNSGLRIYRIQY